MATFQRAGADVQEIVDRMLKAHYPEIYGMTQEKGYPLRFDLLFVAADRDPSGEPVGAPIKHNGRVAAAVIKATSKADRALGRGDVEIRFDQDYWETIDAGNQDALVDHELYHLVIVRKDGIPARDDLGRYRFKMRPHDYEFGWFREIAARHGLASGEVQQAKRIWKESGQFFFGFHETIPMGDLLKEAETPALRVMDGGKSSNGDSAAVNTRFEATWEEMDEVQRETAMDAFPQVADEDGYQRDGTFVFEGPRCVQVTADDLPPLTPAATQASETPAAKPKRGGKKGSSGKKAAQRK